MESLRSDEMRDGLGKALRRAFGQEDVIRKLRPRKAGLSHLMNSTRRRVFTYLLRWPCSHLRELSRSLGVPVQTLRWHLSELESAGILGSKRIKNRKYHFIPARIAERDLTALSLLSNTLKRKIVSLLLTRGTLSQKEVSDSLGTYPQAVQPHLRELTQVGLLSSRRQGRMRLYEVGEELVGIGERYAAASADISKRVLKLLEDDGLAPRVSKRLSKSVVYTVDTGKTSEEMELFFDPLMILRE